MEDPPYRATRVWIDLVQIFLNGIPLKRHWRNFRTVDDCFTGREAVKWFYATLLQCPPKSSIPYDVTRKKTIVLLEKFLEAGIIESVADGRNIKFRVSSELYTLNPEASTDCVFQLPLAQNILNRPRTYWTDDCKENRQNDNKYRCGRYEPTSSTSSSPTASKRSQSVHSGTGILPSTRKSDLALVYKPNLVMASAQLSNKTVPVVCRGVNQQLVKEHPKLPQDLGQKQISSINILYQPTSTMERFVSPKTGTSSLQTVKHVVLADRVLESRRSSTGRISSEQASASTENVVSTVLSPNRRILQEAVLRPLPSTDRNYYNRSKSQPPASYFVSNKVPSHSAQMLPELPKPVVHARPSPPSYDSATLGRNPFPDRSTRSGKLSNIRGGYRVREHGGSIENIRSNTEDERGRLEIRRNLCSSDCVNICGTLTQRNRKLPGRTIGRHVSMSHQRTCDKAAAREPVVPLAVDPPVAASQAVATSQAPASPRAPRPGRQIYVDVEAARDSLASCASVPISSGPPTDPKDAGTLLMAGGTAKGLILCNNEVKMNYVKDEDTAWKLVLKTRLDNLLPGTRITQFIPSSMPAEWIAPIVCENDIGLVGFLDNIFDQYPDELPDSLLKSVIAYFSKRALSYSLTDDVYRFLAQGFIHLELLNNKHPASYTLNNISLSKFPSGKSLEDFNRLLPPNSCFETAFTTDSPITRIVPQRSVDTLHLSPQAGSCDNLTLGVHSKSKSKSVSTLPLVRKGKMSSIRSLSSIKRLRKEKVNQQEKRQEPGGYVNPGLVLDDVPSLDYIAALGSIKKLMECSRKNDVEPANKPRGKSVDVKFQSDDGCRGGWIFDNEGGRWDIADGEECMIYERKNLSGDADLDDAITVEPYYSATGPEWEDHDYVNVRRRTEENILLDTSFWMQRESDSDKSDSRDGSDGYDAGESDSEGASYYTAASNSVVNTSVRSVSDWSATVKEPWLNQVDTVAVMFVQLAMLCVQPEKRGHLRQLLLAMKVVAQWPKSLIKIVNCLSNTLTLSLSPTKIDSALRRKIFHFMVTHPSVIFELPENLLQQVQKCTVFVQERRNSATLPSLGRNNNVIAYCEQVSTQQFEQQKQRNSQTAISNLLNDILSNTKMTAKEKKKKLKMMIQCVRGYPCQKCITLSSVGRSTHETVKKFEHFFEFKETNCTVCGEIVFVWQKIERKVPGCTDVSRYCKAKRWVGKIFQMAVHKFRNRSGPDSTPFFD